MLNLVCFKAITAITNYSNYNNTDPKISILATKTYHIKSSKTAMGQTLLNSLTPRRLPRMFASRSSGWKVNWLTNFKPRGSWKQRLNLSPFWIFKPQSKMMNRSIQSNSRNQQKEVIPSSDPKTLSTAINHKYSSMKGRSKAWVHFKLINNKRK